MSFSVGSTRKETNSSADTTSILLLKVSILGSSFMWDYLLITIIIINTTESVRCLESSITVHEGFCRVLL